MTSIGAASNRPKISNWIKSSSVNKGIVRLEHTINPLLETGAHPVAARSSIVSARNPVAGRMPDKPGTIVPALNWPSVTNIPSRPLLAGSHVPTGAIARMISPSGEFVATIRSRILKRSHYIHARRRRCNSRSGRARILDQAHRHFCRARMTDQARSDRAGLGLQRGQQALIGGLALIPGLQAQRTG